MADRLLYRDCSEWLLPSLKQFVPDEVVGGGYGSVSEYVRELLREARKRKAEERLEQLLLEGLESGDPTEMTEQDWKNIRREALSRIQGRKIRR